MPLLDLFHPPVSLQTFWESFHAKWAVAMAGYSNGLLPRRYAAEVQIHLGRQAEADVAEFDQGFSPDDISGNGTPLAGASRRQLRRLRRRPNCGTPPSPMTSKCA